MVQEKLPSRVLLLTGYDDSAQALHAVLAGAAGYCSKDIDSQTLANAIREVAAEKYIIGTRVMARREVDAWLDDLRGAPADHPVLMTLPESSYLKCVYARVGRG